jgi:hypothetical protein
MLKFSKLTLYKEQIFSTEEYSEMFENILFSEWNLQN